VLCHSTHITDHIGYIVIQIWPTGYVTLLCGRWVPEFWDETIVE